MEDTAREPCPWCREPAAVDARVCPHCRRCLTVDLLAAPILDPRARYLAARDLGRLGEPFSALPRLQGLLASGESPLASGITRAAAAAAIAILQSHGSPGRTLWREEIDPDIAAPQYESLIRPQRQVHRMILIVPAALALGLLLWFFRPSHRDSPAAPAVETAAPSISSQAGGEKGAALTPSVRDRVARALDSTASVVCAASAGSGFFAAPDLLVTNEHVLCRDGAPEVVLRDGRRLKAQTLWRDDWLDLALLRVPGAAARPLALGDATRVAPGDTVLMIGNPVGMSFTVTRTIVSHSSREVFGLAYVQFDGNVNPGNSGGPLLDEQGRAVGIVSMMVRNARGLGLALPINYLYERSPAELPLPIPPPDFSTWRALVQTIKREEEREIQSARTAFRKPGLSNAALSPDGQIHAVVIARGMPAGATPLSFTLLVEGRMVCQPSGMVESWDLLARRRDEPGGDPRYARWLEKAGLSDISVGSALLHLDGCPDPAALANAELLLRDADPAYNRTVVRPMRESR
jgi:serine protease Do